MRFRETNPQLTLTTPDEGHVWFTCPHCIAANIHPGEAVRIRLPFARGASTTPRVWGWDGNSDPERITFTPSVNILNGHWHGFIRNGAIVDA